MNEPQPHAAIRPYLQNSISRKVGTRGDILPDTLFVKLLKANTKQYKF